MATGMAGQNVTSTPVTFNGSTIPVGARVESISINAGGSTSSGLIMPNFMHITNANYGSFSAPWAGTNNSVVNTNAFNGLTARASWTIHWSGPVHSNTLGTILNPSGTAAIRGFNNIRLTINYRVAL